jgi:hypothetical protein
MGTNAGPEIANLCMYADEADFIENLVNSGNIREAQLHAYTSRFIDDVLSWNTLPPPSSCYGLEWRETTNDDGSCTFLGCKIEKRSNGMTRLCVFDKAAEWNFHVIRYPSAKSNIPTHQPAGIFTGQVTRFWQICNNTHDFKHAVTQLTLRLLLRGHHASTLAMGWNKYVQAQHTRTTPLTTKLKHWFKRMVKWAFHHPLPDPNSQPGTQTNRVETSQPPPPQPQEQPPPPPQPCRNNPSKRQREPQEPLNHPRKRRRQEPNTLMCGLHAINDCITPYNCANVTATELSAFAFFGDQTETGFLPNERELRAFRRASARNRTKDGFSIQALLSALQSRNLNYKYNMFPPGNEPATLKAFLIHQKIPQPGHFLALVKRNDLWELIDNHVVKAALTNPHDVTYHIPASSTIIAIYPN